MLSERVMALILMLALILTPVATVFADDNAASLAEEASEDGDEIIQEVVTISEDRIHKQVVWIDENNEDKVIEEIIPLDGEYEFEEALPAETITIDSGLLNVTLPADISFSIDPYELNGEGQIYSDEFEISNQSEVDVLVRIDSLFLRLAENGDIVVLEEPFDDENISDFKEICMAVDFTYNGENTQVVLAAENPEQPLEFVLKAPARAEDSEGNEPNRGDEDEAPKPDPCSVRFRFSGSVNPDPLESWSNGDISIMLDYFVSEDMEDAVTLLPEEASDSEVENGEKDSSSGMDSPAGTAAPPEASIVPENEASDGSPEESSSSPDGEPEPERNSGEESPHDSNNPIFNSKGSEDSS